MPKNRLRVCAWPLAIPGFAGKELFMTDTLPDRLALDPDSKFHDADLLQREIGVRFNGAEKTNVEEYCVSEGWIRVAAGKALDRKGKPLTLKLKGKVEVWLKDQPEG
jgi:hypothetical protein|tara:strand:+ start:515 stop:835 length:321 start_codon:yes stop_codon:yes gene_type:complete